MPIKIWQSNDRRYVVRDGHVFLSTLENAKPVEVQLTKDLNALETILLRLLLEAVDDIL